MDNERIIAEAEALAAHFEREEQMTWRQMARIIEEDIRKIRDEYEAPLDELRNDCEITLAKLRIARIENEELRARIADLEGQREPKGVEDVIANDPGFFNAENMDYLHRWVSDHEYRIATLEEAQREGQGTL